MSDLKQPLDASAGAFAVSGDAAVPFEELVEVHQDKLCNFIFRYTRNRQDAEDLTQDTFVKAFKNFHRYDGRFGFSAWLYTIARRTVYNHYRDRRPTQELNFEVVSSSPTPEATAEKAESEGRIWAYVRRLKAPYSEVLMLKYAEELSIEEIARVMGRTQTGVKILLFRARNQLRALRPEIPLNS